MTKNYLLASSFTGMFLILSVVAYIIPNPAAQTVAMLTLPLFFALLLGLLAGGFFPLLLMLTPLVGWFITKEGDFWMEVLPQMVFVGSAGFFAGRAYDKFHTAIGSNLMGFFTGVLFYGIIRFLVCLIAGEAYQLVDFLRERFLDCWPGVIIALLAPPIICIGLRRAGILRILRGEDD